MGNLIDLTGKRFGRLVVSHAVGKTRFGGYIWHCRCDCGKEKDIDGKGMRDGKSKSCGCLSREIASIVKTIHGMSNTRIYEIWSGMIKRCYDNNSSRWNYYGGRGITVCDRWLDFELFYEDMGESYRDGLSIDRIDNNGSYSKENCRWATKTDQARNKRNNHYVEYNGEAKTIAEWADIFNINQGTLRTRIFVYKWSTKDAIETPVDIFTMNAKLTEEDVMAIRDLYNISGVSQRELAIEYNVKQSTISSIVNRKTWKNI